MHAMSTQAQANSCNMSTWNGMQCPCNFLVGTSLRTLTFLHAPWLTFGDFALCICLMQIVVNKERGVVRQLREET